MSKSNARQASKPAKTLKAEVIKAAEDDTVYQEYIEQATALNRELEKSTLMWYWKMGDLYTRFLQSQANNEMGTRTIDHFIQDLASQPIPVMIAPTTLYAARQIRERYKYENISAMIDKGICVNHLKLMLPIKDAEIEQKVAKELVRADGTVIPVRQLTEVIREANKNATLKDAKRTMQDVDKAKSKGTVVYQSSDEDDKPALKTPAKGEHKTAKPKEFSISPLKAFKTFDKHAISTIAAIGDALIAAYEGSKVGFDSDRAQKNYKEALDGALGTAEQLIAPLQELIKEMKSVRKDV